MRLGSLLPAGADLAWSARVATRGAWHAQWVKASALLLCCARQESGQIHDVM